MLEGYYVQGGFDPQSSPYNKVAATVKSKSFVCVFNFRFESKSKTRLFNILGFKKKKEAAWVFTVEEVLRNKFEI